MLFFKPVFKQNNAVTLWKQIVLKGRKLLKKFHILALNYHELDSQKDLLLLALNKSDSICRSYLKTYKLCKMTLNLKYKLISVLLVMCKVLNHTVLPSEQSSPMYPSSQRHRPFSQRPLSWQLLRQLSSAQLSPSYPLSHAHFPPMHRPLLLQFAGQESTEQSSPAYPSWQRQLPSRHWPRARQSLGQAFWLQSSLVKPSSQTHWPSTHLPRFEQLLGQLSLEQSSPAKPAWHEHTPSMHLPRP